MEKFDWCFKKLLEIEGGFSNHPDDNGGATNWGITSNTLSEYMGRQASEEDVKQLTDVDASRIYFVFFWEPLKLDEVQDLRLAYALFDQAVNRGPRIAVKNLQDCLNDDRRFSDLTEDGIIGPNTIIAINSQNPDVLGLRYCERIQDSYARIVNSHPEQSVFLRGWIARTHKLQRMFWIKGVV